MNFDTREEIINLIKQLRDLEKKSSTMSTFISGDKYLKFREEEDELVKKILMSSGNNNTLVLYLSDMQKCIEDENFEEADKLKKLLENYK